MFVAYFERKTWIQLFPLLIIFIGIYLVASYLWLEWQKSTVDCAYFMNEYYFPTMSQNWRLNFAVLPVFRIGEIEERRNVFLVEREAKAALFRNGGSPRATRTVSLVGRAPSPSASEYSLSSGSITPPLCSPSSHRSQAVVVDEAKM